jgi:nucleoside-diphosphate-sugar epimerase
MKHVDELALRTAARDIGAAAVFPRIFSLAGSRMTKPDLYALGSLIKMARTTGRLNIRSRSRVVRTYAAVDDVVTVALWLAMSRRDAVFDTGGHVVEIGELAAVIADVHNLGKNSIVRDQLAGGPDDVYRGDPTDWNRFIAEAGFQPTPLRDLVLQTSDWLGSLAIVPVASKVPTIQPQRDTS